MLSYLLGATLLASTTIQSALALPTISQKGSKFFAGGQQFFLKGVAYQGTPADPLEDTNQCQQDANLMQTIGTNSIRVYHVNPYVNHDGCMNAFAKAGIYIWLDLDTFNTTIVQTAPKWTTEQFQDFAKVMDVFQGYENLGGFWIGNEVINMADGSPSAPYIKAAVSDMKAYMTAKKYRKVPIGYSAADIAELRPMLQNYLACGSKSEQSIDFFGLNSYEWCGYATFDNSGYHNLQQMAQSYSIPIFFSETGCNVPEPRPFTDQAAIFGPQMIDTWSGSIIYEWVEETNHYGLVTYPNGQIYSGAPIPIQPDFSTLASQWKNINPVGIAESAYTPSFAAPACPSPTGGWGVNGDVPLPTLNPSIISAVAANAVILPSSSSISSSSTKMVSSPSTSASSTSASLSSSTVHVSSSASTQSSLFSSSPSTGTMSTSSAIITTTSMSGIVNAATTTTQSPTSSTSGSSAGSVMLQRRSFDGHQFWSSDNMALMSAMFYTIILPMIGVIGVVTFL